MKNLTVNGNLKYRTDSDGDTWVEDKDGTHIGYISPKLLDRLFLESVNAQNSAVVASMREVVST